MKTYPNSLSPDYQQWLDELDPQVLQADRAIFRRLQQLGYDPQVVFDVGASNSGWSYYLHKVLSKAEFYLFEPLIDYSEDYRNLMEEMLRVYPNFHLYKYALGEKNATVTMNVFEDVVSSSTLTLPDVGQPTKPIEVPMLTLDQAIQQFDLPQPQVIKIDTQGNELAILKGASNTLAKVDVLFLETWLYRGYGTETPLLSEIANWLQPFNFELWDVGDGYRDHRGILATLDCVFLNRMTGLMPEWYYG